MQPYQWKLLQASLQLEKLLKTASEKAQFQSSMQRNQHWKATRRIQWFDLVVGWFCTKKSPPGQHCISCAINGRRKMQPLGYLFQWVSGWGYRVYSVKKLARPHTPPCPRLFCAPGVAPPVPWRILMSAHSQGGMGWYLEWLRGNFRANVLAILFIPKSDHGTTISEGYC